MPFRFTTFLVILAVGAFSAACGSGGGGGGDVPGVAPPSNLIYGSSNATYRTDGAIPPNVPTVEGDPVTSWSIEPALPAGLVFDPDTGLIDGSPIAPMTPTTYVITAINSGGQTTTQIMVEIKWIETKSIEAIATPTDDDFRHFLERTHFGFSDLHNDELRTRGLPEYLDLITTFFDQPTLEDNARMAYLVDDNDPDAMFPAPYDVSRWWKFLAMATINPFQEKLAMHWHDHFACSALELDGTLRYTMVDQINLWRTEGAGNARDLILRMARDWAMLDYLDGIESTKIEPNENFGREFLELYCLGVDNHYTQHDIEEAARAFTGYKSQYDNVTGQSYIVFDPDRHDPDDKTILGTPIGGQNATDDYAAVVDATLAFKDPESGVSACAQWLCRSLVRHFCFDDPPQELIDQLAAILEVDWELKPVLKTLFQSEAFFSNRAKEGLVKTPEEQMLGFMRATGLVGDPTTIYFRMERLGNQIAQPPTVDGWPEGTAWFSAQAMVERANVINYLTGEIREAQTNGGLNLRDLLPDDAMTSGEVVDALALRFRLDLAPEEEVSLAMYLELDRDFTGDVFDDPWDVTDDEQISKKMRGLIYIMTNHPSYLTR